MVSLDFNFAEPTASFDESSNSNMDASPKDFGSIKKSDFVVLNGRPAKVMEVAHSKPGKHGHAKVHLVAIDIFTERRYEDVHPAGHMVLVPNVTKKDYIVINIEQDDYITLLDDVTCVTRSDLKLRKDSALSTPLRDKFQVGDGQIKVTVLKALGEEQIIAFKVIE